MGAQTAQASRPDDEARIRECIQSWTRALRARDVAGVMSHYTPDVLAFDLAPPLQHTAAEYRHGYEEWFKTWAGPIECEIHDLHIRVGGDVAYARSLNHLSGARTDGGRTDIWIRGTICFEKVGGRWLAAHEHLSVPFYMDGSYKAAVDLKP